ncbi:monocarboxylate transporter 13-like [Haliotis rubra]|uniref:monocarboxylate transporter 13-like n=1 Tax=Haliotis rubra TaxID=36100 RepID=UPI001EE62597|nr:monocarboxylate transporter 13-like [Haliotis rubra]XP_046574734.1 monocarboxylate transporter 13-like [Haliotis rubra]
MAFSSDIDRGWAWLVVASSFIIHTLTYGVAWSTGVYNTIFIDAFGDSKSVTAWAGSLTSASMYAAGPLASVLTNKFGCRPIVMVGGALSAGGLMLSFFAPNIYYLYFSFGIMTGLGFGIAFIPAITAVAHCFEKYRGIATGITVSGVGVGTFIFPPVITLLRHMFGWRSSLLLVGAICLNICVCGALVRPVRRVELRQEKPKVFDVTAFRKCAYLFLVCNNVLVCFGLSIVYLHLMAFAEVSGRTENESSMLMSSIGVANLIGRFALGSFGNHPRVNVVIVYSVCFILSGMTACFYPVLSNSYIAMVTLSSLFGFFTACFGALLPALLVQILGIHRFANGYGFLMIFMALGQMIGGPFAGLLYDITGSYDTSFYVGGSVIILGGVLPLFKACRKKADNEMSDLEVAVVEEEKQPLPAA